MMLKSKRMAKLSVTTSWRRRKANQERLDVSNLTQRKTMKLGRTKTRKHTLNHLRVASLLTSFTSRKVKAWRELSRVTTGGLMTSEGTSANAASSVSLCGTTSLLISQAIQHSGTAFKTLSSLSMMPSK